MQAGRDVGAKAGAKTAQIRFVDRHAPQGAQRAQRRRRIARTAADAGGDRQVLLQMEGGVGGNPGMTGEQARGTEHQIVLAQFGETGRLRTVDRQGQRREFSRSDPIADIGKRDEAVDQMIAVRPHSDQM